MTHTNMTFSSFGLNSCIITALNDIGYVQPSPIQAACIPYLIKGKDVLGMAQTGSGKTAAFALPLLHNIKLDVRVPQILVLTPTRELAVQVAEAFSNFSKKLIGVHVLALYGGQRYDLQLKSLRKGPQIIVGTPGRLLDHLKRRTLSLSNLHSLVLDEADEMLRMGFIEDVETIMTEIPDRHQTALFSATMPEAIRRISRRFMKNPKEIRIQSNITTRPDIQQSYWMVYGKKTDALIRFLEAEDFSATIIFVRTKNATLEVSEVLERYGYNSAALNGDMNQSLREQTLEKLKDGRLDILIATDVAARGLDVDRISFVINYDIPMDSESYVHRIGRTGRAGRKGKALLFVENRERRLLRNIERAMNISISEVNLPKSDFLSKRRLEKFAQKVQIQLDSKDLHEYRGLLPKLQPNNNSLDIESLAAALLKMAQGERSLIVKPESIVRARHLKIKDTYRNNNYKSLNYVSRYNRDKNVDLYRIDVGRNDGVEVRHIVGAIANEGDISSRKIGNVRLFSNYSTIELPKGLSNTLPKTFIRTKILNKFINIKLLYNSNFKGNYNDIKDVKVYNSNKLRSKKMNNKKFVSSGVRKKIKTNISCNRRRSV
ncbi:ATP-dependent RNA helicase [Buchnera aphidicola str. Bp (Baizongia pistaciae)]|uniref:ATP-dependent RNA helicase DeaD n=1 Tax=Buchnera aphidicola subsp. Baizongia pistaciae (strain Bp) TaxID=224915 RepID=DEAD_BUCBP|nr:DEAD/DEAH box helicase [Buchnera aphidicola]Q89AF9.1 RecName: Full=ATP-dependent RNA helicase DeaD; AltName: Full=Cold-shock DEAD box protein A [Buchnera aphidicola str. Bp (Baizongia pistaciae)]AAO27056.1 ATP-dependent RNA helicase [Buchnera aphidicola str. Bp (Baizongia pistaciae)]